MINKKYFLLALAALSPQVFAAPYDMEFYTSGNFHMVVDAFKRVSLFYAANIGWVIAIFILGLMVSALIGSAQFSQQKLSGGNASNTVTASMFMALIGSVVFSAGVLPKGTVHVYDQERNQYQSVPGVPAIITMTTGLVSRVVYAFSETENTANAYTYGQLSDGSPFNVIKKAIETTNLVSGQLAMNISTLYDDCAAAAVAAGELNIETLKAGTFDIFATLDGVRHNTIETTYYSDANPSGVGVTCNVAYNNIKTALTNTAIFNKQLDGICAELGLDATNAAEKITCQTSVTQIFDTVYGSGVSSWNKGMENLFVANAISQSLAKHQYGDAMNIEMSRNNIAGSMGAMEAGYRFIPVVKGALLAVIIGAAPVLLLFVVTPMIGKALLVFFGLFIFYGIWQMLDMVILSAIEDSLYAATGQLAQAQMGFTSILKTGSVMNDAFTTLASARTVSISLAVFITATLFRVNAQALGSFAQKIEGNTEEGGVDAGKNAMLSEKAGETLGNMVNGNANLMAYGAPSGMSGAMRSETMNRMADTRAGNITADNLGGVGEASQAVATDRAASAVGEALSTKGEGLPSAIQSHTIQKDADYASSAAIKDVAATTNQGTKQFQTDAARLQESKTAGEKIEMSKGQGIIENGINLGRAGGAEDRATANDIAVNGSDDAYRTQEQEIEKRNEGAKAIDKLNPNSSRDYFREKAELETKQQQGTNIGAANVTDQQIISAAAGDLTDQVVSSSTKTDIAGGIDGRKQLAEDNATIETQDDIANIQLREALKDSLGIDDAELSRMMLGEKQYNLNQEQAEKAHEAGIINDQQMAIANKEGALVLDMNATGSPDGKLDVQSTSASFDEKGATNKSTEYDASNKTDLSTSYDRTRSMEAGTGTINDASAREIYGSAPLLMQKLSDFDAEGYSEDRVAGEVGMQSAQGLRDIVNFSETDNAIGTTGVGVSASVTASTPDLWVKAQATADVSNRKEDVNNTERSENVAAQHFADTYKSIDKHYDEMAQRGEITTDEARQKTAETYAGYYSDLREGMASNNIEEFDRFLVNGNLDNVWEQYQEKNGLNITNHNERNDKAELSEDEKKYGASQSGMASGVLGAIAGVGLDASTLSKGDEVQGANAVESTNQADTALTGAAITAGNNGDEVQGANAVESTNQTDTALTGAAITAGNNGDEVQGANAVALSIGDENSPVKPSGSASIELDIAPTSGTGAASSFAAPAPVSGNMPAGTTGFTGSMPPQGQQNVSGNMPPVERASSGGNLPPLNSLELPNEKREI